MDKKQFKEFCKNEFKARGFKKQRNVFYLTGHDLLCGIDLQKSNYGDVYYVNYYYFIGEFKNITDYPTHCESDIQGRIAVMSRKQTFQGKQCRTLDGGLGRLHRPALAGQCHSAQRVDAAQYSAGIYQIKRVNGST